ncbi:MAG: class I SAM-dependent methyltransferase [Planctomycetaceae bacterium]|nr:class I SAM-dependent methyltransferase [Planctomycetaceae bacterium]
MATLTPSRSLPTTKYLDQLEAYVRDRHPRSLAGIVEARLNDPARFEEIAETFMEWAVAVRGEAAIGEMVDSFVRFTTSVNMSQVRYERAGHYENKTFEDCLQSLYTEKDEMDDYLWGVYLTNFLWAHHTEIILFFTERYLKRLDDVQTLIEIAPGHGGWGAYALKHLPQTRLVGYDIAPSSIEIATQIMNAAGFANRARYELKDALNLEVVEANSADAVICNFLIEHLERPEKLMAVINHLLKPGQKAFLTGALTAAQIDHIYEFRYESELVKLAEDNGLRVLETFSGGPRRTLPNAKFLPRSMALIMQKRQNDIY